MELVYKELSYELVGCCFEVHNQLGGGHKERIYQKGLASELKRKGIDFKEQVIFNLKMNDEIVGRYILDFLVEDKIVLEIKSNRHFRMADYRQANAYLQALDMRLALLVVFTTSHVRFKRVLNIKTNAPNP